MPKRSNPIDKLVGSNIRMHRIDRGMSQTELGCAIGVTFQQVQKYEKGTNRVGSGLLFEIASILNVPIPAFFEGADYSANDGGGRSPPVALLSEPYALRLMKAFCAIENVELRRNLAEIVQLMTEEQVMTEEKANVIAATQTEKVPGG